MIGTIALAMQTTIPAATAAAVVSGIFLILEFVSINTMIQMTVSDGFRGRVLALYTLSFLGMVPFGALLLGGIANAFGTDWALGVYGVIGGVLGLVILFHWPQVIQK